MQLTSHHLRQLQALGLDVTITPAAYKPPTRRPGPTRAPPRVLKPRARLVPESPGHKRHGMNLQVIASPDGWNALIRSFYWLYMSGVRNAVPFIQAWPRWLDCAGGGRAARLLV